METPKLKAGILIISDTASEDPSTDRANQALSEAFENDSSGQWAVYGSKILPDDALKIQQSICQWCDGESFVNLIVTTGGTGFAIKDRTPEAIHPLIHRHAPGLV